MELRRDERAVTVQIGAVLLLAIVFTALALYQVNAVPAENEAIETEHNQQVHGEMQDLRNAIKNAGTSGGSKSVSITLGTQYPTRTFSMNPPDPAGTLETTGTQTLRIKNADVISEHDGTSDPENVIGEHSTTTLRYQPDYNEYRGAPTTRIEHGFAYNDFRDAQLSLTDQPLIDGDRITVVLLEGNLSAASTSATTVDTRLLDGPTDPVTIKPDGGKIMLTVPTQTPDAWNESLQNEPAASVTGFSDGALSITLEDDEYKLQMARVGVGDATTPDTKQFDIRADENESTAEPAYPVEWENPSGNPGIESCDWSEKSCTVTGDSAELTMGTAGRTDGAPVEYAVSDRSVGTVSQEGETGSDGTDTTTFDVNVSASDGDTVSVYTSSGGDSDTIDLTISRSSESESDPSIDEITITDAGTGNDKYDIAVDVSDANGDLSRVDFEMKNTAGTIVDSDSDDSIRGNTGTASSTLKATGDSDIDTKYTVSVTVFDAAGNSETETETVTSTQ